jgi:hypothetical protein
VADNADVRATLAIDLEDGTSGPAESANKALRDLREAINADTKALSEMQAAMKNLQSGTVVNVAQFKELKAKIDAKKQAISQAQSAYLSLGGTFGRVRMPSSKFKELTDAIKGMPGPLGALSTGLGGVEKLLSKGAIAFGIIGIVGALSLLVAGTAAAALALGKFGVAEADARRSELLQIEGLTKLRNWYGIAAGNALEMRAAIDKVSDSTALGRGELLKYETQLYKAGLRGQNLTDALEGVAIKASVQGDAAAQAFAGWAVGAAWAGQSVKKLSDDVKARLGGIAARQMLSLDVQSQKMRQHFGRLFADLKIEGLLKAVNVVTSLFSQATASGQALKTLLEVVFQPMVDAVEFLAPSMKRFFQGVILGSQDVVIALLDVALWFKRAFGGSDVLKGIDLTSAALSAGKVAAYLFAGGLAFAAVTLGGLAVSLAGVLVPVIWSAVAALSAFAAAGLLAVAPFALGAIAIAGFGKALYELVDSWDVIVDWAREGGGSFVDGLIGGMKAKWAALKGAVVGMASGVKQSLKDALGIHSPSKEFAKLGKQLPAGLEVGIKAGSASADRAVADMVGVPAGAKGGGGSVQLTIEGGIHLHGAEKGAREHAEDFVRELERVLGGVNIQMGGA